MTPAGPGTSVAVREASFPADGDVVSALLDDYLRQTEAEKAEHGLAPAGVDLPDRYAREVADPAAALAGSRILLASVTVADGASGGGTVDCGIVVVSPTPGTDARAAVEIKRFWTTPAARGSGVGTALLDAALATTDRPVRLSVWEWREPALRLYLRLGFAVVPPWDERAGLVCLERG